MCIALSAILPTLLTAGVTAAASSLLTPKGSTPVAKQADPVAPAATSASSQESEASVTQQRRIDALRAGFASTLKTGAGGATGSPATLAPAVTGGKKALIGQ